MNRHLSRNWDVVAQVVLGGVAVFYLRAAAFGVDEDQVIEVARAGTADSWCLRNWGFFDRVARSYTDAGTPPRNRPWRKDLWDVVTVARELDLTRQYLNLEQLRLGEAIALIGEWIRRQPRQQHRLALRQQRRGVGVQQHERRTLKRGRKSRRHRDVAAGGEHERRPPRLHNAPALPQRAQQVKAAEDDGLPSLAAQPGEIDRVELDAARLDARGLARQAQEVGLTALFLRTLPVWQRDDTPGLERTRAVLRRNLGWLDRLPAR